MHISVNSLRPRFRVATLLWLMLVMAAYFCGRRSPEIDAAVRNWWQVTRVAWGAEVDRSHKIVLWPRGSVTINESAKIVRVSVQRPQTASTRQPSERQLRITPSKDGQHTVIYKTAGSPRVHRVDVQVEDGTIVDCGVEGP